MKNPPISNEQKNWNKLLTLLDKTTNQTVHNLISIAVFFTFLSDEKTIIKNICFSQLKPIVLFVSNFSKSNCQYDR